MLEWVEKVMGDLNAPLEGQEEPAQQGKCPGPFQTSSSKLIASTVVVEISKCLAHSNIPTVAGWRVMKNVLDLNSKYQNTLKHLKHDSPTVVDKRAQFQTDLKNY